jgi:hypothetical protein
MIPSRKFIITYLSGKWTTWPVIGGVLAMLSGCMIWGGVEKPTRHQVFHGTTKPTTKPVPLTSDDLVIYLDTSSPMKGYVSADGQSVFSRTLRTVLDAATTVNKPVNVHLRTVDSKVGALQAGQIIGTASINQNFYTGSETNLVAAIDAFDVGLAAAQPSADASLDVTLSPRPTVPPARFHLLLTDGVQYTKEQSSDQSCLGGSSPICVRKKLIALLSEKGWAGSVIGLRSQFCCAFFSELSQNSVAYSTKGRKTNDYRPFYLLVFSPDHEALKELVVQLKERLRKTVGEKDLILRELALTSSYTDVLDAGQSAKLDLKFDESGPGAPKSRKIGTELPMLFDIHLDIKDSPKPYGFTVTMPINWSQSAVDMGDETELVNFLTWELEPSPNNQPGGRLAEIKLADNKKPVYENGQFKVPLVAYWPRAAGTPMWQGYHLTARLNLDKATPAWVREWSTDLDTTPNVGNKTLYLESTLLNLWRNPVLKKQPVLEVGLRIGPSN